VVDKLVEAREKHLKQLRFLVKKVRFLDERVDEKFEAWQQAAAKSRQRLWTGFKRTDKELQSLFSRFHFKQRIIDEMTLVTENIRDKMQSSLQRLESSITRIIRRVGDDSQVREGKPARTRTLRAPAA